MEKSEKISKSIADERDEAMSLVTDDQLLEERGKEEEDEKREAVLSNILSLLRYNFAVGYLISEL